MRILQINSASAFGGGEKHVVDLSVSLQTRGHDVFIVLRSNAAWREKLDFLPQEHRFVLPLKNALDINSARALAQIIQQQRIEIVHAHLARDYPLAALAVRLSRTNVRLVLTRHVLFPLKRWHKFLLPSQTRFIAVSKAVRNSLLKQNIVSPEQITLIYNGIDTQSFAAAQRNSNRTMFLETLGLSSERRYIGIVGEIAPHKGQTDFVRAAAKIANNQQDVDFLIVGRDNSMNQQHQIELEKLISKLDFAVRIHLVGWQSDIVSVLCSLDVFVSTSRNESFGLAIVEAMAAGVPIVATASAGALEILIEGKTGKIVPIGDVEAIAKAVEYFLHNKEACRTFGEKAQVVTREKFDLLQMTTEIVKIYETLRK